MIQSTSRLSPMASVLLLAAAALLTGCSTGNDLIAAGRVVAEPRIDRVLRKPPEVYEDKGDLVVSGRMERGLPGDLGGHVDVAVVAPDGKTVYDARLNYEAEPTSAHEWTGPKHGMYRRVRTHRYGSYGAYSVRFPGLPPNGSVVKVRRVPPEQP